MPTAIPATGWTREDVRAAMQAARSQDVRWQEGRAFSLVFKAGEDVSDLLKEAYTLFFAENGLNPSAFPSLRKFESEVVSMAAGLLGGDAQACGSMTSGGTESILMAAKTARDWSRIHCPEAGQPEILAPVSAHPAFDKAAHYLGLKLTRFPLRADLRADVEAARCMISPHTVMLVASAPAYPHGVVDPIGELAALAQDHGLLFHVDACVGGFMLPFVRRLGYPVPSFDFTVAGVTSISADLHKYGYAAKGASVILYRDAALRRFQFYATVDWPGGIYASPTFGGTRPGGAIAAAWAVLNYLGMDGYLRLAKTVMETTMQLRACIAGIPGLYVLGDPEMSVFAIGGEGVNIYDVGDEMALRGWPLDKQQFPPSLHMTLHYGQAASADQILADLEESARLARRPSLRRVRDTALLGLANTVVRLLPAGAVSRLMESTAARLGAPSAGGRSAPMYGLVGTLPNRGDLHARVTDLLAQMTREAG